MTLLTREMLRKSIHGSGIFLVPVLLWDRRLFALLLGASLVVYLVTELLARKGKRFPLLTSLTELCKRESEKNHLARGPIFLALSGIVTPFLFGTQAAAIGLSQAFIADAAAVLIGMQWGKKKIFYSPQKTWLGSLSFFVIASLISLYFVTWPQAIFLAALGTAAESLPWKDGDNISVPLVVGFFARFLII